MFGTQPSGVPTIRRAENYVKRGVGLGLFVERREIRFQLSRVTGDELRVGKLGGTITLESGLGPLRRDPRMRASIMSPLTHSARSGDTIELPEV